MLQEHNGVTQEIAAGAHWCGKRPRQNYKHVEDRTLSDVTEEKTFN